MIQKYFSFFFCNQTDPGKIQRFGQFRIILHQISQTYAGGGKPVHGKGQRRNLFCMIRLCHDIGIQSSRKMISCLPIHELFQFSFPALFRSVSVQKIPEYCPGCGSEYRYPPEKSPCRKDFQPDGTGKLHLSVRHTQRHLPGSRAFRRHRQDCPVQ